MQKGYMLLYYIAQQYVFFTILTDILLLKKYLLIFYCRLLLFTNNQVLSPLPKKKFWLRHCWAVSFMIRTYCTHFIHILLHYTYVLYVLALKEITFRGTKFEAARVACILAKCVTTRLWEQSKFVSKLIPKVGPVLAGDFVLNGKTTLKSIRDTDPRDIERVSLIIYACEKMSKLGMFYRRYRYNCFSNS